MGFTSRVKEQLKQNSFLSHQPRRQRMLLVILLYLALLFVLFFTLKSNKLDLELGKPSPRRIVAEWEALDGYETERLREEAAQTVAESFDYDPVVLSRAEERAITFFNQVQEVRELELEDGEKMAQLIAAVEVELTEPLALVLLQARQQDLLDMQSQVREVLQVILQQGVKPAGVETAQRQASQEINFLIFDQDQKRIMVRIAEAVIEPNMIYNATTTNQARETAREAVQAVRILEGTEIIQERETVTQRHLEQLEALGLLRNRSGGIPMFFGLAAILLIIFITVSYYLYIYQKAIYHDIVRLLLLGLIILLTLTFTIAANYFSGYLVPVAMGAFLIAVLLNAELAVLLTLAFSVFVVLITGNDFRYMLVAMFGGLIACFSVTDLSRRSDLTKAGLYVSAVNVVAVFGLFLYTGNLRFGYDILREFGVSIFAGIANGLFSAVMAIGLLPYLESGFGLTTAVTLLELANPSHPLLKRLLMEAPGTYHHSLLVANLAEAAAETVGGDPLLARVGAFYHDIGKLKRPYFFIENQMGGANPHDKISPNLSTLIITSHIKDGLEMAQKANLPQVIQDIIYQHHGTSLVSFFFQQAERNQDSKEIIREENFRYEAAIPQTKEAAIIMIADAVEAAVRSLSKPAVGRVEAIVRKIIKDKLNDGQFDQCDLTLKDLDTIAVTLVKILSGIYHTRIEYPEKELKAEIERGRKNGGSVK
ncbi:MAG TPA: HDIG domain-containing protein [Oscillospiraceae bacterium]|nr:HDIG domain-containing protein [Oscillospiraceae bacterium]